MKYHFPRLSVLMSCAVVVWLLAAPASTQAQSQSKFGTFSIFHGSGLYANATTSNNWSGAGIFGGLSGSVITTNGVPLYNAPLGIDLLITFNAYTNGAPTNTQFYFALSPDGTNYSRDAGQFLAVSSYSGTALGAGATNGYSIRTNFTQAMLGNSRGIRYERLVNNSAGSISNVTVRYSYFY